MSDSHSFDRLRSEVRTGDMNGAGEIIVRRFAARLAALAAARISDHLVRRGDADDVVQEVYRTFFRRLDGGLIELRDWDSLWGLLARITVCRVLRLVEHNTTAGRSQDREDDKADIVQALDRVPTAEEGLIANEQRDHLIAGLSDKHQAILQRIFDGAAHEAIAKELATSIATVERVHRRARDRLKELLAAEA